MNLPNRITLARIAMIPLVLLLMALTWRIPAGIVFILAALTDQLDGYLARKRGEITDFGKFMDPIADKLLVLLPMIYLCREGGALDAWAVLIMVAREIVVGGFRLVAVTKGVVIAAGVSGKIKTIVQMVAAGTLILGMDFGWYIAWVGALLSAYSGAEILIKNRRVLEEGE